MEWYKYQHSIDDTYDVKPITQLGSSQSTIDDYYDYVVMLDRTETSNHGFNPYVIQCFADFKTHVQNETIPAIVAKVHQRQIAANLKKHQILT